MIRPEPAGFLELDGVQLEYRFTGPLPEAAPTLVLLHEGLGCAAQWGPLPEALAAETGCGVLAYSRQGYGASSPVRLPRRLDFLEREAEAVLPRVLDGIGFRRGLLIGHSDGASIAALALAGGDPRIRGGALIAPHFFVEAATLAGARRARAAYEAGTLRERLARRHADVEGAFRGWNEAWLDPDRSDWDIRSTLARCGVPLLILQGAEDAYGTRAQIEAAQAFCPRDCLSVRWLPGVGHEPQRQAFPDTLAALTGFIGTILGRP
ncbi:alpha/beta fold hydrolase [Methylobacterium planeticum]|uniref:Alpha/beta hydrolase n=1 Tax=Methylobacterium planeticum TaxID=2615211 RepID=A0A6N6MQQ8_9HYPH|nr:alpha/beta hydrolase [Methylobacterium planeticum]KAB1073734.1 alpha/beta hydrolase [Methylobacterium planeticum]